MSLLSGLLSRRVVDDHPAADVCAITGLESLGDLRPGDTATIASVCAGTDPASARRLFDLGFAPGSEVSLLRRAPMADPMIFRVAGYDIALRRAQAQCVRILPTT
ncbi:MAG: ferrous iron transport protein A [Actinomycetota bacterium]|nr:ferrous iron transport protein A [Actinomycetota bacterium]